MNSRGFSMLEVLVAVLVLVFIGTAIASLALTMISTNISSKLRNQGVAFSEEAVEQSRNFFQLNGFASLSDKANGNLCYIDGNLTTVVNCPGNLRGDCTTGRISPNGFFYRFVALSLSSGSVKVSSVVSWLDRNSCRSTEVGTYYYSY